VVTTVEVSVTRAPFLNGHNEMPPSTGNTTPVM
jgi:hypothetical protein